MTNMTNTLSIEEKTKWFNAFKGALETNDVEGFFVILDGIISHHNKELMDYIVSKLE